MTLVLVLAHVSVAALWLGSTLYSLFVVQPAVARARPGVDGRGGLRIALARSRGSGGGFGEWP